MIVEESLEDGSDLSGMEGVVVTEGAAVTITRCATSTTAHFVLSPPVISPTRSFRDGFELRRKVDGHERYSHENGRRVTVPYTRRGDTFAIGTLRSIIEVQAQWTVDDLRRLDLIT